MFCNGNKHIRLSINGAVIRIIMSLSLFKCISEWFSKRCNDPNYICMQFPKLISSVYTTWLISYLSYVGPIYLFFFSLALSPYLSVSISRPSEISPCVIFSHSIYTLAPVPKMCNISLYIFIRIFIIWNNPQFNSKIV